MLGSWVCFQLLLGCVLLLGQPVCGVDGESEEPDLTWEDDSEEPQSPLEENVVEDALLQALEDLASSQEDSEELEERASVRKQQLEEHGEFDPMMSTYKQLALKYYNERNPGPLYRHLEDTEVEIKKAIGTLVTFTIFLVNTNCTKEEARPEDRFDAYYRQMGYFGSEEDVGLERCDLPPESEREILKCTFTLYLDGGGRLPSVIGHSCRPTIVFDELRLEE